MNEYILDTAGSLNSCCLSNKGISIDFKRSNGISGASDSNGRSPEVTGESIEVCLTSVEVGLAPGEPHSPGLLHIDFTSHCDGEERCQSGNGEELHVG